MHMQIACLLFLCSDLSRQKKNWYVWTLTCSISEVHLVNYFQFFSYHQTLLPIDVASFYHFLDDQKEDIRVGFSQKIRMSSVAMDS